MDKILPLIPALESPCVAGNCARQNKNKENKICRYCKAREDFSLASGGDKAAHKRYLKFDYKNMGQRVDNTTKKIKIRTGRSVSPQDYYNEKYLRDVTARIRAKFGSDLEFADLGEAVMFLYVRYKMKTRVAKFVGLGVGSIGYLWKVFDLPSKKI